MIDRIPDVLCCLRCAAVLMADPFGVPYCPRRCA
jgi:hypothetical protein